MQHPSLSDCIEAPGYRNKDGYAQVWVAGRTCLAHREAWKQEHGQIPPGLMVLHTCDNPPCINTEHLYLGDNSDNMQDRTARGRCPKANQTECIHGHEFTEENTYYRKDRPGRQCRRCKADRQTIYRVHRMNRSNA